MTDLSVTIDLAERYLCIGTIEITLSNHQIQQLRTIAGTPFDDEEAEEAVNELIDDRIQPFLDMTSREPIEQNLMREIDEAFGTHLYMYADGTELTEEAE